jgi:hypothetical protein
VKGVVFLNAMTDDLKQRGLVSPSDTTFNDEDL